MFRKLTIVALAAAGLVVWGPFAPVNAMLAGSARVQLEIPEDAPLAGHNYRLGRSAESTNGALFARCLFIDETQFDVALVTLDVWGITPELRARVLEMAPDGLDPKSIILTATGNYSGPGGIARAWDLRRYYGRYMPEMIDALANGAVAAIGQAMQSSTRATIGFRIGNQDSLTQSSASADAARDHEIGVVRVDDSDGNPIAILGVLSAAVRTLGEAGGLTLSAEFPGVFCTELEGLSAEGTVALFLNGASGDQEIAPQESHSNFTLMEYVGKELAVVVKGIANTITCDELPISTNHALVPLPDRAGRPYFGERVDVETIEVGELLLSFVPGAPVLSVKQAISSDAGHRGYAGHILVGGANGSLGILGPAGDDASSELVYGGADWLISTVQSLMRRDTDQ